MGIPIHLVLRFGFHTTPGTYQIPVLVTLVPGGLPLLRDLVRKLLKREFGCDLPGGISILTFKSPVVPEQFAGCRTAIFDKTGTLTYGEPKLTGQLIATGFNQRQLPRKG